MLNQFFIQANDSDKNKSFSGLMLMFAVGFIPIFLGIEIQDLNINIEWFGRVIISNTDNAVIFYTIVNVLTCLRFYLRSSREYQYLKLACLLQFFLTKLGRKFLATTVFSNDVDYRVGNIEKFDDEILLNVYTSNVGDYSNRTNGLSCWVGKNNKFHFKFFAETDLSDFKDLNFFKRSDEWGAQLPDQSPIRTKYISTKYVTASSFMFCTIINVSTFVQLPKIVSRDITVLDFLLPIILNLSLCNYLLYSILFK